MTRVAFTTALALVAWLAAARDAFLKRKENEFAINRRWAVEIWIGSRKTQDYLGPPSESFRAAAGLE